MDDDFNTALAISNLFGIFKSVRAKIAAGDAGAGADLNQIRKTYSLLGLFEETPSAFLSKIKKKEDAVPAEVIKLAEERAKARADKDWASSDRLRDEILKMGYTVKDSKEGYTLEKKN